MHIGGGIDCSSSGGGSDATAPRVATVTLPVTDVAATTTSRSTGGDCSIIALQAVLTLLYI